MAKAKKKSSKKPEVKTITVANLCRENDIDPKKGRGKLRKAGWSAKGKTYPPIVIGSKRHTDALEVLGVA
jgi:hypothetical protein